MNFINPSNIKSNMSAFVLGFTSIIAQIVFIRELFNVFYGNELCLGIILGSWLLWVGLGSMLLGQFADKSIFKQKMLSFIQIAISITLPVNIIIIRSLRSILDIPKGEIISMPIMLISCFSILSLIGLLMGFSFSLIAKISSKNSKVPAKSICSIYLSEGLGAGIGGILFSIFLIKFLSPIQTIFIISCLNLLISLFFNKNILQIICLIMISIAFIFNLPKHIENYTKKIQYTPFNLIESIDSEYGNISLIKHGSEYSCYENNFLVFTTNDVLTSEQSVHYALLQHPSPEKVLLIGGGLGGSLQQILKHNIKKIDYVELDPLLIKTAQPYVNTLNDPRINIFYCDGRRFVKKTASTKTYDVIIMNLPDPYTAMLNRFYSLEFFEEVKHILEPNGIFSFSLTSSENYINSEQAYYLGSIYNTLKKNFLDVKILPGDTAIFLASKIPGILTYDAKVIISKLKHRNIYTEFVTEYYIPFKLDPLRIKYLENSIKEYKHAKINKDFRPIGYFYYTSLWLSLFNGGKNVLLCIKKITLYNMTMLTVIIFLLIFIAQRLKKISGKIPIILSIGTTGMSEISFQIIILLAFQCLYGYIYYKISLILASFMLGLVLGSFLINKTLGRIKDEKSLYLKIQSSVCIYPLLLPLIFSYISNKNFNDSHIINNLNILFVLLPIIAGLIGGLQFPLANKICLKDYGHIGKTTGLLYGVDLLGSSIGGILISMLLIPMLGINSICIYLSIVNVCVFMLLLDDKI